jgi:hypothetical protein
MSNVLRFERWQHPGKTRAAGAGEQCAHHRLRVDPKAEVVTCSECGASLAPLAALSMLADQYGLALARIDLLKKRVSCADERIRDLSGELDALAPMKRPLEQRPTEP